MAIERFQNKDILVESKVPVNNVKVYSLSDESNLTVTTLQLEASNLISGISTTEATRNVGSTLYESPAGGGFEYKTKIESHIYSADQLLLSNESELVYELNTTDDNVKTDILINPERDVRLSNIETGYYSIVYNFVKSLTPELKVVNVNADLTEVELEVKGGTLSKLLARIEQNDSEVDKLNLGLNFGNNKIQTITDLSFYNNKRVGEVVASVMHPTDTYNDENTFFAPSLDSKDQNQWIEFYSSKKPNAFGFNVYQNTGRSAKFNLAINEVGNAYYQIEVDSNGDIMPRTRELWTLGWGEYIED